MNQSCSTTIFSCGSGQATFTTDSYCVSNNSKYISCSPDSIADSSNLASEVTAACYWCSETTLDTSASSSPASTSTTVTLTPGPTTTPSPTSSSQTNATSSSNATSSNATSSSATSSKATSSNATSSNATSSVNPTAGGKVNTGTATGIGIGCTFVGALLAGLIVFYLSRRKHRQASYRQQHLPSNGGEYVEQEKRNIAATRPHANGGLVTNVDHLLPQPAEDDVIIGGLSKLRDSIKNHIQNYYHNAPVGPKKVDEARLVELARATAIPTSAISDMILNPATRMPMIRLFLGHLILSRCSGRTDGTPSFLPNEVSALAASYTWAKDTTAAQAALFSKWKTISGTLIHQQYSQQPGENDPRDGSITQAIATAEPILHLFINPSIDINARRRNLEGIMRRAAQYSFLIFSQPGSFSFDYTGTGQHDSLVVFPALLQTVDDEAEVLSPPRVLSEKEAVTGLGM